MWIWTEKLGKDDHSTLLVLGTVAAKHVGCGFPVFIEKTLLHVELKDKSHKDVTCLHTHCFGCGTYIEGGQK